ESGRVGLESVLLVARALDCAPSGPRGARIELERAWVQRAAESPVKRLRDELRAIGVRRSLGQRRSFGPSCSLAASCSMPLSDAEWHASLRRDRGTARK